MDAAAEIQIYEPMCAAVAARPHAEERLVLDLLAGNEQAWQEFHSSLAPSLMEDIQRVRRQFPSLIAGDEVRDILAELCVQLLAHDKRRLRQFNPAHGTSLRAWLGVLARHAAFDFLRVRRRQPTVRWRGEDDHRLIAPGGDAPDAFAVCYGRERAGIVATLIGELSERDREFVELHFYEGLDPEQTAERLGICVGTVYSKKHKIRARIETLLGKRLAA
jgi:RNA polymerase sigma-70 factor, ECF subfamily